jgi:hypothetical protein
MNSNTIIYHGRSLGLKSRIHSILGSGQKGLFLIEFMRVAEKLIIFIVVSERALSRSTKTLTVMLLL